MAVIVADLFAKLGLRVNKRSFQAGDRLLTGIKTALIGIAGFTGFRAFRGMIRNVADAADNYNKMAQAVGISSESLQGLDFAAQLSGTDVGILSTGLQRLARNADSASRGSKTAKDSFKDLGVSFKNADGTLRQTDDILVDIADRFQVMPDGTTKTALAMNLFGRAGAKLIPLLNAGSTGIAEMRQEFEDLGGLIDTETNAQFEALNDEQLRLDTAIEGIKKQLVIALLPTLREMTSGILAWVKANRVLIKQRLERFILLLVKGIRLLLKFGGMVIELFNFLIENSDALTVALLAIATAFGVLRIASIKAAIASTAAWLAALAPFVVLAALIAAIVLIVEDLWRAFTGGESVFKDLFLAAKEFLLDGVNGIINDVRESIEGFFTQFTRGGGTSRIDRIRRQVEAQAEEQRRAREDEGRPVEDRIARRQMELRRLQSRREQDEFTFDEDEARRREEQLNREILSLRAQVPITPVVNAARPVDQSVQSANTLNANITVNASGSSDDIATRTTEAIREMWDSEMRKAASGGSQ